MLKRRYQKKCLLATTLMLLVAIGLVSTQPVSAATTYHFYKAKIYVVTDDDYSRNAMDMVKQVKSYLDSSVHYLRSSTSNEHWVISYYLYDKGSQWDTSDVTDDTNLDQMLNDLDQDWGYLSEPTGSFVIGFTDKMDKNGVARRSEDVCIVAAHPEDWWRPDLIDNIVALHELAHLLGDLAGGDNGHVDRYKTTACVMNYARWVDTDSLCGACKDDIRSQAWSWPVTTTVIGAPGGPN